MAGALPQLCSPGGAAAPGGAGCTDTGRALVAVRDASPDRPGILDLGRWDAAREDTRPALAAFGSALAAVPRHDRVARTVGREWYQVDSMLLWHGSQ